MVVGGELVGVGNHRNVVLLFHTELPLAIVPLGKILGLQLSQGLNYPRDEGLVLHLPHSLDCGLRPIVYRERHKSWDGP